MIASQPFPNRSRLTADETIKCIFEIRDDFTSFVMVHFSTVAAEVINLLTLCQFFAQFAWFLCLHRNTWSQMIFSFVPNSLQKNKQSAFRATPRIVQLKVKHRPGSIALWCWVWCSREKQVSWRHRVIQRQHNHQRIEKVKSSGSNSDEIELIFREFDPFLSVASSSLRNFLLCNWRSARQLRNWQTD